MTTLEQKTILATTLLAITLGTSISYILISTNLHRELTFYDCTTDDNKYTPVKSIMQSGPEFIIINPEQSWGRNSFLVSKELEDTPTNWRYLGLKTVQSTWAGFALEPKSTKKKPVTQTITFDSNTRELKIIYNENGRGYKADDINITCKETNEIKRGEAKANNVSINYLKKRNSGITFLRPRLDNKAFNKIMYTDISKKEHSEYGIYQLLKFLGNNQRDSEENSIFQNLEQTLINNNSQNATVWEFDGDYRYWHEYPNEKGEANKNAGNWCRSQQYGSKDNYLTQGYKVVSNNPDNKSTNGWVKQTYTDGRFAGYVNYKAVCDGRTYRLKKDGTVDDHSENTYGGGR